MVSRNWARSTLGPGTANEDEEVGDYADTFCFGERVELAVTMENKAEVSRMVGKPRDPVCSLSSPALPHCPNSPPPGQADRK